MPFEFNDKVARETWERCRPKFNPGDVKVEEKMTKALRYDVREHKPCELHPEPKGWDVWDNLENRRSGYWLSMERAITSADEKNKADAVAGFKSEVEESFKR